MKGIEYILGIVNGGIQLWNSWFGAKNAPDMKERQKAADEQRRRDEMEENDRNEDVDASRKDLG
jgi:hypothetical protein